MKNETNLHPWPSQTSAVSGEASNPTPSEGIVVESNFKMSKRYARAKLQTSNDIAHELARVYRAMKSGELDPNLGTKLTYVLSTLAKLRMDSQIEERIEILENRNY